MFILSAVAGRSTPYSCVLHTASSTVSSRQGIGIEYHFNGIRCLGMSNLASLLWPEDFSLFCVTTWCCDGIYKSVSRASAGDSIYGLHVDTERVIDSGI